MTGPGLGDDDEIIRAPRREYRPEPRWARVLGSVGMAVWIVLALLAVGWVLLRGGLPGGLPW